MHWVMITRKLDPRDDRAGFMMRWVEELAARLDQLDVICQESAAPALPDNVRVFSMGKEAGAGRIVQARRFTAHLHALVPGADGVFCHMIPRYVLFAAPWARLHRKPLLFWYTHRQISLELRLAHPFPTRILTAAPGSYPIPTPRLTVIGHGIESDLFPPPDGESDPPEVIQVARLSPIKRQDDLLRAAGTIRAGGTVGPFRVVIVGGAVESEPGYAAQLETLAGELGLADAVTFTGPLPHVQVAERLRASAITVNLSPPGLFDKAALEGMFAGKPTLVTNPDFLPLLGDAADLLSLPYAADAAALSERLARLLALTPAERAALGADLRARALEAHSLAGLMDRLAAQMRAVSAERG